MDDESGAEGITGRGEIGVMTSLMMMVLKEILTEGRLV